MISLSCCLRLPRTTLWAIVFSCTLANAGGRVSQFSMSAADLDETPWEESEVPPAPAFNQNQLVPFDASRSSELSHGIDPGTVSVGATDGVVRYVRVASSRQGALNAVYEGVRCNSAEVRSYAYWNASSQQWHNTPQSPWRPLNFGAATQPARMLAYNALCDGPSPNGKPEKMMRDLRYGKKP